MTITMQKSDKFETEKRICRDRKGTKRAEKRGGFNINPKYVRTLGEALVKFADENKL